MLELELVLDVDCGACGDPFGVTVRCAGRGLVPGKSGFVAVRVPCPNPSCHCINEVIFTPDDGRVQQVTPERGQLLVPAPSFN